MHFVTSINLLYVLAPECQHQGVFLDQRNTVQHTNLGIALTLLE